MFILTERTPNPDAMKFTPHVRLTDGTSFAFMRDGFDPSASALAGLLFALPDIVRVYVTADFVTLTRAAAGQSWTALRLPAVAAIAEHLASGAPAVAEGCDVAPMPGLAIEAEIREVIDRHVQSGVARDGGAILIDRFEPDSGVLWIRMQGACGGCPSSRLTLKAGVEAIVRRFVPEVMRVEDAGRGDEAAAQAGPGRLRGWLASLAGREATSARTRFTHGGKEMPARTARSTTPPSLRPDWAP